MFVDFDGTSVTKVCYEIYDVWTVSIAVVCTFISFTIREPFSIYCVSFIHLCLSALVRKDTKLRPRTPSQPA